VKEHRILVIRAPSGLSGDMTVAGLASLVGIDEEMFSSFVNSINLAELEGCSTIIEHSINNISGYRLQMNLPKEHSHRSWHEISSIINSSSMQEGAKEIAINAFHLLAMAEGQVHSIDPDKVTFHEVGALDSIFDMCMAAILLDKIKPNSIVCSPLPISDGEVLCNHGVLMTPVPAVQELLSGVAVYGIDAGVETVTPTALAILKGAKVQFGLWPDMTIDHMVRAYGNKIVPNVQNGAIFALGTKSVNK
jgi:pyridinium-3,5-bisthiocarboxylic acid mononucleotide nickel chelatase